MVREEAIAEPAALLGPGLGDAGEREAALQDLVDATDGEREASPLELAEREGAARAQVQVATEDDRLTGLGDILGVGRSAEKLTVGEPAVGVGRQVQVGDDDGALLAAYPQLAAGFRFKVYTASGRQSVGALSGPYFWEP